MHLLKTNIIQKLNLNNFRTMQNFSRRTKIYSATATIYDEGLRQYFLRIYALMTLGLAITAIAAFAVFSVPTLTNMMFISPLAAT